MIEWMNYRVLDKTDPSTEEVRVWGYDERLLLIEVDEDLVLYDTQYIPVLLELAADESCPKTDDAFWILCQFSRRSITGGDPARVERIRAAWEAAACYAHGRPLAWREYVGRLLSYHRASGPVSNQTAERMAEDLLLGPGRIGKPTEETPQREGWWRFVLRTSITESIEVCHESGTFSYAMEV